MLTRLWTGTLQISESYQEHKIWRFEAVQMFHRSRSGCRCLASLNLWVRPKLKLNLQVKTPPLEKASFTGCQWNVEVVALGNSECTMEAFSTARSTLNVAFKVVLLHHLQRPSWRQTESQSISNQSTLWMTRSIPECIKKKGGEGGGAKMSHWAPTTEIRLS